jgi:hypothetical protein
MDTDEVVGVLEELRVHHPQFSRNYSTRKELVAWKLKLKDLLLSKYQLLSIPKSVLVSTNTPRRVRPPTPHTPEASCQLKQLLARKVHKMLRRGSKTSSSHGKQKMALQIIDHVEHHHNIPNTDLRKAFHHILRELRDNLLRNGDRLGSRD